MYRLKQEVMRFHYRWRCRSILRTPPLQARQSNVVFFSMVSHRDLLLYLVAIKSIYRWLDGGRIVVMDDGTLSQEDHEHLSHHLDNPEILNIEDYRSEKCPQGGTWERLLAIVDLSQFDYVIQIDSDLLAIEEIDEVRTSIESGRSFVLGTNDGKSVIELDAAPEVVKESTSDHVQVIAEKSFPNLGYEGRKYVRGCSGFTGFAPSTLSRSEIEQFSQDMTTLIGSKWSEWGSEQVTSNYLVANSSDPLVLPYPKYANFHPAADLAQTHFYHFMGSHRFQAGRYVELSRQVIADLGRG